MTYDSTGTYTNVYTDANGCDSTVTLDLTVNYSSSSTVVLQHVTLLIGMELLMIQQELTLMFTQV